MDDDATDADLNWRKAVVVASPGCKCGQVDVVKSHLSLQPCKLRDSKGKEKWYSAIVGRPRTGGAPKMI